MHASPSYGGGPSLMTLPLELLHAIVAHLVGQKPLGPPAALIPLLLTSRALHDAILRPEFLRRICCMKLDVGAVERRMFKPWNPDFKEQLIYVCRLMRALRRGLPVRDELGRDLNCRVGGCGCGCAGGGAEAGRTESEVPALEVLEKTEEMSDWSPSHVLFACLVLMLDNDGKNFAQLEWAGVHAYVDAFVNTRLWDGALANDGWPLENQENACALWLMWLTMDRNRLENETISQREAFVERIFPYVVLPQRYPASEAPPNHFHLPLSSSSHIAQQPALAFPIPSFTATAYDTLPPLTPQTPPTPSQQHYPHYLPPRSVAAVHFRARPSLTPPPCSAAAKLLYVARRERSMIGVPLHLPADRAAADPGYHGPTQADYLALNHASGAVLVRGARWDWEEGRARAVNEEQEVQGADGVTTTTALTTRREEQEESRKWDTMWWRMRLCGDYRVPKPKFAPGAVFDPGCMRGLWRGKIYIPSGMHFAHILHNEPCYPGVPDERGRFSEPSLGLIMQPIILAMQEHHRVCLGASNGASASARRANDSWRKPEQEAAAHSFAAHGNEACGAVPVPPPAPRAWEDFDYAQPYLRAHALAQMQAASASASPAAHVQGPITASDSTSTNPTTDPTITPNPLEALDIPEIGYAPAQEHETPDGADTLPSDRANRAHAHGTFGVDRRLDAVDRSMSNAWFPGALGGVQWTRREGKRDDGGEGERRNELLVSVEQEPDAGADAGCVGPGSAAPTTWVYETYDPQRVGAHEYYTRDDAHNVAAAATGSSASPPSSACRRCAELEAKVQEVRRTEGVARDAREDQEQRRHTRRQLRREKEQKRKEDALRMLDEAMRAFGTERRGGVGSEEEELEEMQDLDMEGVSLGLGADEEPAQYSSRHYGDEQEYEDDDEEDSGDESDEQLSVLGDDNPDGQAGFWVDETGRVVSTSDDDEVDDDDVSEASECEYETDSSMDGDVLRRPRKPKSAPSSTARPKQKRTYIEATRREFSPSLLAPPSAAPSSTSRSNAACPSAAADILLTGYTPPSARIWGQAYLLYGRVRPWDGLVGMLRVGRNSVASDYLFMFGYVVGGRTFVGEWRLASSDIMRPTWGSAVVLSRADGQAEE